MTERMSETPRTDNVWDDIRDIADSDDELAPFLGARAVSRLLERELAASHLQEITTFGQLQVALENLAAQSATIEALRARVTEAERILRPLYECDPDIRVWFGDPAYTYSTTDAAKGQK